MWGSGGEADRHDCQFRTSIAEAGIRLCDQLIELHLLQRDGIVITDSAMRCGMCVLRSDGNDMSSVILSVSLTEGIPVDRTQIILLNQMFHRQFQYQIDIRTSQDISHDHEVDVRRRCHLV